MKDWTVMVYMSGDNNLSADMVYAMQRIRESMTPDGNLNLFVYYDGATPDVPTLYCNFSDMGGEKQYYRAQTVRNPLYPPPRNAKRKFDENSAAMESIANFVDWCVNKVEYKEGGRTVRGRKAKRYALIFSGHTLGFQSVGLLKDEESDYYMTLRKLRWMLTRLTGKGTALESLERANARDRGYQADTSSTRWIENTTPVLGQPLDIIGFDSCVMGMLEVGYQFQDVAKTLIASEGSIPNAGWSYADIFACLSRESALPTSEIAKSFVQEFIRAQDRNTLGGITVDLAAWDLSAMEPVAAALGSLGDTLFECFREYESPTYTLMRRLITHVHRMSQSYMLEQNIDLADFCGNLIDEISMLDKEGANLNSLPLVSAVRSAAESVIAEVEKTVLIHGFSGGKYQFSKGMSVFFPWSLSSYKVSKEVYDGLMFIRGTSYGLSWRDFLEMFVGYVSLRESMLPNMNLRAGQTYYTYRYAGNEKPVFIDAEGVRQPINGGDKQPIIGKVKQPIIGKVKQPIIGKVKQPIIGKVKQPLIGKVKQPLIGKVKSPINPTQRIAQNDSERLFGGAADFFGQFMETKNIQTFWNISGISDAGAYENLRMGGPVIVRSIRASRTTA